MLSDLSNHQFLQNALIVGILTSVVAGIIGVVVVEKKMIMIAGGIAHASCGGVGLGYLLGFTPMIGAFIFSIISAFSVGFLKRNIGANKDIIIGLFWSLGMALGVVFIAFMPGYPPNLSSYLFGSILTATRGDLLFLSLLTIFVIILFIVFFNNWKAYLFDKEFAYIRGISTTFLEYLLLFLIGVTIVVLIRSIGIILCISMLIAPAAAAKLLFSRLEQRILAAVVFGFIFNLIGLSISYYGDLPSGGVIVIVSVLSYLLAYVLTGKISRRIKHER